MEIMFPNCFRYSPLLLFRHHDSLPKFDSIRNTISRKRRQFPKSKTNTQRQQCIIQKEMEMAQRQAANYDSMCFCDICLKDVSSFDHASSRDYFSVLEHHAFSHYIDSEAVDFFHRGVERSYTCHEDEKNGEEAKTLEKQEESVAEQSPTMSDNNNNNNNISGGQDRDEVGPRNAQLLSRAIIESLKIKDHHHSTFTPPHVHLILVQDSVDHRSDTAMDELKTRILQHLKRDVVPVEARGINAEIQIYACFFIGVHRARSLHEMVICPLHDEYYSCCLKDGNGNNNNDNHQPKFDIDLRSCLLIPPRSTNSTERIVYCLVEMLSVLSQSLANHRNSGWLAKDNADNIKNRKRSINFGNYCNNKKRLSIGILCDHQHVWTNLVTLFGKSGDFDLVRI